MNKLDDKVIIDRDVFVGILDMARHGLDSGFFGEVYHQDFAKGEQALAADLTGWAAVPVEASRAMIQAGMDGYNSKVFGSDGIAAAYSAMLEATLAKHGEGV